MLEQWAMLNLYSVIGLVIVSLVLAALWVVVGYFGKKSYDRLVRMYHFRVVWYWLNKLENEGVRCFEKAEQESVK